LYIFQLTAVKLLEVVAHYANTGKETLSPFIDSSYDKILLQTNLGCTSRFLTSQTFLDVFSFILTHIMLGLLSPGSAKADVG